MADDPHAIVRRYHEVTKHHQHRHASSLGYLDWATQPHPFRRFEGAPLLELPFPESDEAAAFDAVYDGAAELRPVGVGTIARLFYFSMALSAWKQQGDSRWALRVNPSSGNLHPTEAYLVAGVVPDCSKGPAVFHYAPDVHGLEHRAELDTALPEGVMLIVLTSIHWREAWKYGERAYRYCQHDAGHALAAIRLSAGLLGWSVRLLTAAPRRDLAALVGVDRDDGGHRHEPEVADMALLLETRRGGPPCPWNGEEIASLTVARFHGEANRLSHEHHPWPIIDEVERAVNAGARPDGEAMRSDDGAPVPRCAVAPPRVTADASALIRRRRSAVAMDGRTGMTASTFFRMLARTLPLAACRPWDAIPWAPRVHLGLFVHRVEGLAPGLYALARNDEHVDALQASMHESFSWCRVPAAPAWLPCYLLAAMDTRDLARTVSCHQDIAADGAFGAGMLAWFDPVLNARGPACYPQLFWETGAIGQVLYLEAEAAGLRATGIGCFFDDAVHEIFGLRGRSFQSLYHFTVGRPVDDTRITTLPAYDRADRTGQ